MKFITSVILTALLSIAACLFLPWWSIAIAAFLVSAIVPQKPAVAFAAGFTALLFTWGTLAWYLSSSNGHLLAHKISMLILKMDNPFVLITATSLIGALVGGFAALTGSFVRKK
jgi:hypothetical protein